MKIGMILGNGELDVFLIWFEIIQSVSAKQFSRSKLAIYIKSLVLVL